MGNWIDTVIGNSVVITSSSRFSAFLGHGSCDGPFCYRDYLAELELEELIYNNPYTHMGPMDDDGVFISDNHTPPPTFIPSDEDMEIPF